jgi:hypothetical protein
MIDKTISILAITAVLMMSVVCCMLQIEKEAIGDPVNIECLDAPVVFEGI